MMCSTGSNRHSVTTSMSIDTMIIIILIVVKILNIFLRRLRVLRILPIIIKDITTTIIIITIINQLLLIFHTLRPTVLCIMSRATLQIRGLWICSSDHPKDQSVGCRLMRGLWLKRVTKIRHKMHRIECVGRCVLL